MPTFCLPSLKLVYGSLVIPANFVSTCSFYFVARVAPHFCFAETQKQKNVLTILYFSRAPRPLFLKGKNIFLFLGCAARRTRSRTKLAYDKSPVLSPKARGFLFRLVFAKIISSKGENLSAERYFLGRERG